jgi:hypothetical protein
MDSVVIPVVLLMSVLAVLGGSGLIVWTVWTELVP